MQNALSLPFAVFPPFLCSVNLYRMHPTRIWQKALQNILYSVILNASTLCTTVLFPSHSPSFFGVKNENQKNFIFHHLRSHISTNSCPFSLILFSNTSSVSVDSSTVNSAKSASVGDEVLANAATDLIQSKKSIHYLRMAISQPIPVLFL